MPDWHFSFAPITTNRSRPAIVTGLLFFAHDVMHDKSCWKMASQGRHCRMLSPSISNEVPPPFSQLFQKKRSRRLHNSQEFENTMFCFRLIEIISVPVYVQVVVWALSISSNISTGALRICFVFCWLIDWLMCPFIRLLIDWLIDVLIDWLIDLLFDWLIDWLLDFYVVFFHLAILVSNILVIKSLRIGRISARNGTDSGEWLVKQESASLLKFLIFFAEIRAWLTCWCSSVRGKLRELSHRAELSHQFFLSEIFARLFQILTTRLITTHPGKAKKPAEKNQLKKTHLKKTQLKTTSWKKPSEKNQLKKTSWEKPAEKNQLKKNQLKKTSWKKPSWKNQLKKSQIRPKRRVAQQA